jgi:hypothetical protein
MPDTGARLIEGEGNIVMAENKRKGDVGRSLIQKG